MVDQRMNTRMRIHSLNSRKDTTPKFDYATKVLIIKFIDDLPSVAKKRTYPELAKLVAKEFGRPVSPSSVRNWLNKRDEILKKAEAERKYFFQKKVTSC